MEYKLTLKSLLTTNQLESVYLFLKKFFDDKDIKTSIRLAVATDSKKQTAAARVARSQKR